MINGWEFIGHILQVIFPFLKWEQLLIMYGISKLKSWFFTMSCTHDFSFGNSTTRLRYAYLLDRSWLKKHWLHYGTYDGYKFNRLLHNRQCNKIENHNQNSITNPFWQPCLSPTDWGNLFGDGILQLVMLSGLTMSTAIYGNMELRWFSSLDGNSILTY